ncbi:MAG: acetylglutamate kinase [Armatimonadetes bacterium JP3_11]|jgi:acetylglutamate kinase|nr:MAG: acetylglutamate kinase [Armatimonadetes bacterium CP1_7O]OYT74102.1 MAG: acetylglutamate kinase [Armatimonadetes bacterium JP3_11]RMH08660.1 MAG: acetylglutamate kinase [Armatimonadota bacterium]
MSIPDAAKLQAEVLIQALPYIQRWSGATFVIKYGGAAMGENGLAAQVMQDIVLMHCVGIRPVIVHGGGPEISELMKRLGKQPQFVNGLRVTDAETMELVEMALTGKTNPRLVALIQQQGGRAVGISGKDGGLIRARKIESEVDLGFVGEVASIQPSVLHAILEAGYIPVVSPIGMGADGATYNLNADFAAGALAGALEASKFILMTDVPGVLSDPDDPNSLISELTREQARRMLENGRVSGGMIPKLQACLSALESGCPRAHIIDGRVPHALLIEVFTDEGIGTMIR